MASAFYRVDPNLGNAMARGPQGGRKVLVDGVFRHRKEETLLADRNEALIDELLRDLPRQTLQGVYSRLTSVSG